MNCDDLIRHYKSRDRAMKKLGIKSRQLWHVWEKSGIPAGRQAQIQIDTRGRLRADQKAEP